MNMMNTNQMQIEIDRLRRVIETQRHDNLRLLEENQSLRYYNQLLSADKEYDV